MSELSKAQKVRLGVFLLAALSLAVGAILAKVGASIFASADHYSVRLGEPVGGLLPGADVTYNGIVVGKVGAVMVDPIDVAKVRLDLELRAGTPVPENASATVVWTGITGARRVDLVGGTGGVRLRRPGEEIPAGRGLIDALVDKAERIGERLDRLASDDNLARIERTLGNVERVAGAVVELVDETRPRVARLLDVAADTGAEVALTLADARRTMRSLDVAIGHADRVARDLGPLVGDARGAVQRFDALLARVDGVVGRIDKEVVGAIGRTQGDVARVLRALGDGVEQIGELAEMLVRDPSSLVVGKSGKSWAVR